MPSKRIANQIHTRKRKKSAIPLSVFEKTCLPRVMQPVGGGCIILGRTRHSSWVTNDASSSRFTRGLYKHFATVQPLAFRRGGLFPRASISRRISMALARVKTRASNCTTPLKESRRFEFHQKRI
ncbi:hypothetical protein L596_025792 [Steinernema carpocapsae]|uniref:Uncharacterized protein n=1 Tax=Steinernema carpocapsae TaxID=34508 RepID=A0A4U5M8T8_STECR|nr:hypothetical protein L596_025792 [Steinernema carpocapsae]